VQQPPTATNLSDGFINYGGVTLIDVGGNTRNATYALNVSVTPSAAAVPEPATIGLMLIALSGTALLTRKYSQSHSSVTIEDEVSSK
jgi:PEP-CTERM motif